MTKQTKLEKAIIRLAKAAGEIQRAATEIKEAVGAYKGDKPRTPVFCEKCESEMTEQPLERDKLGGGKEMQYRCPNCGMERWA